METPIDWKAVNPVALWRDWIVKSEAQWSQGLSELMKDERISAPLSRQVDELRMMQRQFAEMAQASLAAANLPSRSDLEALDERMGQLEDGLAQVAAALSRLEQALTVRQVVAPAALARTRKPSPVSQAAQEGTQAATRAAPAPALAPAPAPAPASASASASEPAVSSIPSATRAPRRSPAQKAGR